MSSEQYGLAINLGCVWVYMYVCVCVRERRLAGPLVWERVYVYISLAAGMWNVLWKWSRFYIFIYLYPNIPVVSCQQLLLLLAEVRDSRSKAFGFWWTWAVRALMPSMRCVPTAATSNLPPQLSSRTLLASDSWRTDGRTDQSETKKNLSSSSLSI